MKNMLALGVVALVLGVVSPTWASKQDEAIKAIQVLKTSKDVSARIQAAIDIGNIGQIKKSYAADAIPYLVESLKAKEPKLRSAAAEALGKVDPPEETKAVELLTDLVQNDKEMNVKLSAIKGLASLGPVAKPAMPALNEIMAKEDKKSKLYNAIRDASRAINVKTK